MAFELLFAALAVLAVAPLSTVGADGDAAVSAHDPEAVMLADARVPEVLALAPAAVMLTDSRAPAFLALSPAAVVV